MPDTSHKLFRNTPAAPAAMHKLSGFLCLSGLPSSSAASRPDRWQEGPDADTEDALRFGFFSKLISIKPGAGRKHGACAERFDVTDTALRKAHRGCEPRYEQRGHFV